ncbi:unnamed protein product, partial [Polarella glacialis]
ADARAALQVQQVSPPPTGTASPAVQGQLQGRGAPAQTRGAPVQTKGRGKGDPSASSAPPRGHDWNAADFAQRLAQAKATQDRHFMKSVLKEVAEHNYALRSRWPVPRTLAVTLESCLGIKPTGMGRDPEVTFSSMSTADALLHFSLTDRSRQVCGLNFANGKDVGGGYKNGAMAQEEDLCRRMPTLYTSLNNAKRDGLYPFGPSTCRDPGTPGKYSDVLWTPGVAIGRTGEDSGFALLPPKEQATVSLVAAAAPNIKFANPPELYDKELMLNTAKAILITPVMKNPEITTIILGAWGCGAFGGDPSDISEIFCKALVNERLGRLYKEVHFAIPNFANDKNAEVFRQILRRNNIAFKELDPSTCRGV